MTRWLVSGALLLAASSASAQEGMLFKNLMEGVLGGGGNDIEYRQEPASARNAAWPNDPDVARRRAEAKAARIPSTENEKFRNNPLLTQQELRRGRTTAQTGAPVISEEQNNYNNQIEPIRIGREMAARQNATDLSKLNYGQEPPRRTLIDPPVGYRQPAGSAPLGPGRSGPVEDRQAVGQREFTTGTKPMTTQ
jgi:hypothetical protein